MKIISLNIRGGGGTRIDRIAEYLLQSGSDIIITPEYHHNKAGERLGQLLAEEGYQLAAHTNSSANGIAAWSRIEARKLEFDFNGNIKAIQVGPYFLLASYFPQKNFKKPYFDYLLNGMPFPEAQTIIMGDLNTGLHLVDEAGSTFYCAGEFDALCNRYHDAWRKLNGDKREYSWYSNGGNGFRIDHCLCGDGIIDKVNTCHYDHQPREKGISDHAAMVVEVS